MGLCASNQRPITLPKQALQKIRQILSNEQIYLLHLMYKDLAERTVERKINLENFLLFFHKNGFWGERLFKQFDYDETNLISEEEFIRGIAKIFKSSEKEKISLLFKFFSKNGNSEGVFFNEFLTMLYNYPKEDLKEILNDKEFIQFELKKRMVLIENKSKDGHQCNTYRFESTSSIKPLLNTSIGFISQKTIDRKQNYYEAPIHSMIGKDIIRSIKDKYKTNETVISFKEGDKTYDIRTSNIQQLVKRFALRIFQQAKIDVNEGKLNFFQFYSWISIHKTLYENYYDGFHNNIWEVDPITKKPKYLLNECEKISDGKLIDEFNQTKIRMFLRTSIMVICEQNKFDTPLYVICLEGLIVKRIYEIENGFGFEISHRDGIYSEKKIFLKNENLLFEWMELLKFYKGESIQKKYDIGEKIGTGKFSVVYRCQQIADNKQYALKEIATFKLDMDARNLIAYQYRLSRHESSIMQIVSHPLLLEFKQCIQTKTHIYIVTELVKGKDLFDFVKERQYLDEYDSAKIIQQLIVGIRFLHSFQIVHRDLKPENVMIVIDQDSSEISNIKIIDFGFSNYLSKLHEKKLLAGTPNYIAPEVLKQLLFDFKIDNFAIGVILYFTLTGNLPFNDYTIADILQNTIKGEYKFSDRRIISKEAMDLTDKLLKNNPSERISLEDALKHPWFEMLKRTRREPRSPPRPKKRQKLI